MVSNRACPRCAVEGLEMIETTSIALAVAPSSSPGTRLQGLVAKPLACNGWGQGGRYSLAPPTETEQLRRLRRPRLV